MNTKPTLMITKIDDMWFTAKVFHNRKLIATICADSLWSIHQQFNELTITK